jgi:hypothetical protein
MDADNAALRDPSSLFLSQQYRDTGALFWQDYWERTIAPEVRGRCQVLAARACPPPSRLEDSDSRGAGLRTRLPALRGSYRHALRRFRLLTLALTRIAAP